MKKRILSMFLVMVILFTIVPSYCIIASAATYLGTCGDNLTWEFDNNTGTLTISGTGSMYDFSNSEIPWEDLKSSIKIVVINDGVASIGRAAFYRCNYLEQIRIPKSVIKIGEYAFDNYYKFNYMYYEGTADDWVRIAFDTIYSNPMCAANREYFNNELVENVVLSNGITSINDYVFSYCTSLKSITIPDTVTSIGVSAFEECIRLKNIEIPEGVTTIGENAFYSCSSLLNVTMPKSIISIGENAFFVCEDLKNLYYNGTANDWVKIDFSSDLFGCDSNPMKYADYEYFNGELVTNIVLDSGIDRIDDGAFKQCNSLRNIVIPDSVTSIGEEAFYWCESLQNVIIGDGVTSIGEYAFWGCDELWSISIGKEVASIGDDAFWSCDELSHVLYKGTSSQWDEISIGSDNSELTSATRHVKVNGDEIEITTIKEPTCTESGLNTLKCSICNSTTGSLELYSYGHIDNIVEVISPTCTGYGSEISCCTRCNIKYVSNLLSYLGHDYQYESTVLSTCMEQGYDVLGCTRCEEELHNSFTEIIEHEFNNGNCIYCNGLETDCVSSPHPYPDSYDNTWVISKPYATQIKITFSEKTYTEQYCDYIYIYDANDTLVGKYSGDELSGVCITVNSDKVKIRLTSDYEQSEYGFAVKNVEAHCYDGDFCSWCGEFRSIESAHPYSNNTYQTWEISKEGVDEIALTFSPETYTESNYDYIYIYDANGNLVDVYSGSSLASKTIVVQGDTAKIVLTSDGSNTHYGFKVSNVVFHTHQFGEWVTTTEPTCESEGIKTTSCIDCGKTVEETITTIGHDFTGEWITTIEPTCENDGLTQTSCLNCGEIAYETIDAFGHNYVNGTCVNCGEKDPNALNGWVAENGKWAYYENGVKATNTWKKDSAGWCYLGADGYCVTNCWKADSVGWCYLDANGRMVINNWVYSGGKWYFMDGNGYMVSNTWKADSKGWCYLGSSGAMLTNSWVKDSVGWCYVGADGYCVTNKWVKDSTGWCYLDASGRMVYNKWVKDSKGWCYVGSSGYMVYNQWVQDGGKWYYIDANGYMVTGTKKIGGKTYKFNSNGVWIG